MLKVHHSHFVFQGIHSSDLCLCVCVCSLLCLPGDPLQWSVSVCFHRFAFKCIHFNGLYVCVFTTLSSNASTPVVCLSVFSVWFPGLPGAALTVLRTEGTAPLTARLAYSLSLSVTLCLSVPCVPSLPPCPLPMADSLVWTEPVKEKFVSCSWVPFLPVDNSGCKVTTCYSSEYTLSLLADGSSLVKAVYLCQVFVNGLCISSFRLLTAWNAELSVAEGTHLSASSLVNSAGVYATLYSLTFACGRVKADWVPTAEGTHLSVSSPVDSTGVYTALYSQLLPVDNSESWLEFL